MQDNFGGYRDEKASDQYIEEQDAAKNFPPILLHDEEGFRPVLYTLQT